MKDLSLYSACQKYIKTGDHIGWRSNSVLGWAIRKFTEDSINHSSMAIQLQYGGLEKRRFDIAALNNGIEFHLLSRNLMKYDGQVYWYPLRDEYDDLRSLIAANAFTYLDTPYDYDSLVKNISGRVSTELSRFFCSEYSNLVWQKSGIDTGYPISGKAPTPADIDGDMQHLFKGKIKIL